MTKGPRESEREPMSVLRHDMLYLCLDKDWSLSDSINLLMLHETIRPYLSILLFDEVDEEDDHAEGVEGQDDGDVDARGVRGLLVHVLQLM
jgi:hypothetical protein